MFLGISPRFRPHIFGENVLSFANFIYLMKSRDLRLLKINEVRATPSIVSVYLNLLFTIVKTERKLLLLKVTFSSREPLCIRL